MKKNSKVFFAVLFVFNCCFACPSEEMYLKHIEQALDASQIDGKREVVSCPILREKMKHLFLQIYEEEKVHPECIQCLTAQDSIFYVYQVIAKELYRKLYGEVKEDFEFLRFPAQKFTKNREEFFALYPSFKLSEKDVAEGFETVPEKLREVFDEYELVEEEEIVKILKGELENFSADDGEEEENPVENLLDTDPKISRELLSVSFTLETYRPLDSALFVFLSGKAVGMSSIYDQEAYFEKFLEILCGMFEGLGVEEEKLQCSLKKLIQAAPCTPVGIINQIFLPKEHAMQCLYPAFGGGFLHKIFDEDFEGVFKGFQENREQESFRTFRNFQARLIVGALFNDPRIKVMRYTLIPEETQKEYEKLVRIELNELLLGG
jgi:hypothetical protein